MAQEPRTVQPVEFFEAGRQPASGKDFTIYRSPANEEATPEVEEDPKDSSAIESADFSDLIPSEIEAGLVDAEKGQLQTTTDPSKPTSSSTPETSTGSETPPVDPTLVTTRTTGSPDSAKLPVATPPRPSASPAPSAGSATSTEPAPTPAKVSGRASSTTNRPEAGK